ncbi:MAG: MBL fold metallo-hydrolase [Bacteroidales bacterium]|nr:MBL fold metallo-hydrolase [Bacteroidales bacterium]
MKKIIAAVFCIFTLLVPAGATNPNKQVDRLMKDIWKGSIDNMTKDRLFAMYRMQDYMDSLSSQTFNKYLKSDEATRREMEKGTVLRYYQMALEKILRELPKTKVEKGSVAIWHLYNMGYIVKTPSQCFAVDIKHPEASRLVPYIDFLLITHKHGDHFTDAMNKAMTDAGKPVYANWQTEKYPLTDLTDTREIQIGNISIRTALTDHNVNMPNFVITYIVDCGEDTDHTVFYLTGDTNNTEQVNPGCPVDIFIPHILVGLDVERAAAQVDPCWMFSSHLHELGHKLTLWRWSYFDGFDISHETHRKNVFVPCWGDKIVYRRSDVVK